MLIHHKFVSDGFKFPLFMILLIFILKATIRLVQISINKVLSLTHTQTAYQCILDNKYLDHMTQERSCVCKQRELYTFSKLRAAIQKKMTNFGNCPNMGRGVCGCRTT